MLIKRVIIIIFDVTNATSTGPIDEFQELTNMSVGPTEILL